MVEAETAEVLKELSGGPPPVLFHYTSADGLTGIIESKSLWATNIHYLNDEAEFQLELELARRHVAKECNSSSGSRRLLLDAIADHLKVVSHANICVFSLSGARDQLSQWRAYCPVGGYAIGFDAQRIRSVGLNQSFYLARCMYDEADQRDFVRAHIESFVLGYQAALRGRTPTTQEVEGIASTAALHLAQLAPLLKHSSFKEECEWRLISPPLDTTGARMKYRVNRGLIVPYAEISLSEMDPFELREIVIGQMAHQERARRSLGYFLAKSGVEGWKVKTSRTPYRNW